eukprot:6487553-Amphidinium_carterae.5
MIASRVSDALFICVFISEIASLVSLMDVPGDAASANLPRCTHSDAKNEGHWKPCNSHIRLMLS